MILQGDLTQAAMTWPHHALVLFFTLAGCSCEYPVGCTAEARFSLSVEVEQDGERVCDAQVTALELYGQHSHELLVSDCVWSGPTEIAGKFGVTATASTGTGTIKGVMVKSDGCHVQTQHVTVVLQ